MTLFKSSYNRQKNGFLILQLFFRKRTFAIDLKTDWKLKGCSDCTFFLIIFLTETKEFKSCSSRQNKWKNVIAWTYVWLRTISLIVKTNCREKNSLIIPFFASENKKVDLTISLLSRCFRLLPELFMLFIAAFLISPVQTDRSEIKWNQE